MERLGVSAPRSCDTSDTRVDCLSTTRPTPGSIRRNHERRERPENEESCSQSIARHCTSFLGGHWGSELSSLLPFRVFRVFRGESSGPLSLEDEGEGTGRGPPMNDCTRSFPCVSRIAVAGQTLRSIPVAPLRPTDWPQGLHWGARMGWRFIKSRDTMRPKFSFPFPSDCWFLITARSPWPDGTRLA